MLTDKDKQEYKQGMYDLYVEVGATNILYHALKPSTEPPDIYGEVVNVEYLPPVSLVGTITPLQPTEDPTMYATKIDKLIMKFDIIGLALEKHNLNPYDMITGYFEFDNMKYTINKVTPKGMFTDFYTSYEFITEVVK